MLSKLKNKINFMYNLEYIFLILFFILLNCKFSFSDENLCKGHKKLNSETEIGCYEKRVIGVLILYDSEIILDKEWIKNINLRFEEINKFYYKNFKIEWRVDSFQEFEFDKNIDNLSSLFSMHKEEISALTDNLKAEVVLGLIDRDIKGIGIASTFSNVLMVVDSFKLENFNSSVVIAHELGHLFGAWHTQRKNDFMLFSGANKLLGSNESNAILKLMRNYNFKPSTIINDETILKRISRLYNRHHAKGEIDPVARLLTDEGKNLYHNKEYNAAIKMLKRSNKYYGRWGKTRMILSKSYYENNLLEDSFTEYTRAVFFGSKPDKHHEKKLEKKFIDLQKIDPTISNPFNINN